MLCIVASQSVRLQRLRRASLLWLLGQTPPGSPSPRAASTSAVAATTVSKPAFTESQLGNRTCDPELSRNPAVAAACVTGRRLSAPVLGRRGHVPILKARYGPPAPAAARASYELFGLTTSSDRGASITAARRHTRGFQPKRPSAPRASNAFLKCSIVGGTPAAPQLMAITSNRDAHSSRSCRRM